MSTCNTRKTCSGLPNPPCNQQSRICLSHNEQPGPREDIYVCHESHSMLAMAYVLDMLSMLSAQREQSAKVYKKTTSGRKIQSLRHILCW